MWKSKIITLERETSSEHLSIAPWNIVKMRNFEIEFSWIIIILFYFLERRGEREWVSRGQKEGDRILSRLHTPCWAPWGAWISQHWDQAQIKRLMLTQLNQPGAPWNWILMIIRKEFFTNFPKAVQYRQDICLTNGAKN